MQSQSPDRPAGTESGKIPEEKFPRKKKKDVWTYLDEIYASGRYLGSELVIGTQKTEQT